jgi:processive 1,2-diacylglycerol beta-glucosyltransferase
MNNARPILILTASAGAGHTVAAEAVEQSLRGAAPELAVEIHDVLNSTNAFFRTLYAQGYLGLVNHAPTAMGLLYEATDRPDQRVRDGLRSAFQNINARRTMRLLIERRPRLVINTHFLSAEIVAHLRQSARLDCPQVTVTTDFETHRLWVQTPTERYYTASEEGKAYLTTWGVDADQVLVTGIPVRPGFVNALDRAAARSQLGLDPERPVVLLLCGGFGVGPTEQLFGELLAIEHPLQIVVVTGRNETLRRRLETLAEPSERPVTVVGFTEAMHEWMRAADLVVTKPGGLTTAEALVCGLPLVIVNPIPGQEARNSDYLLEHGAAIKVNNPRLLGYRVGRLLSEPRRLKALRKAAAAIGKPDAARLIAQDALAVLRNGRN